MRNAVLPILCVVGLTVPSVGLAGCTVSQLDDAVDNAENAFADLRVEDFGISLDQIDLLLDCLEGSVTTEAAARVHRVKGIVAFAEGKEDRATFSLTAARRLDPGHPMSDSLVPAGHPIRTIYDQADVSQDPMMTVPEPTAGWLAFDGTRGLERSLTRASVIQIFDHEGRPRTARYLYPGDALPLYPGSLAPRAAEFAIDAPLPEAKPGFPVLGVTGGLLLLTGAAGLAAATSQRDAMYAATTMEDLDAAFGRQQLFGYGGYALVGTGALGLTLELAL